jgi:trans-aconitate methyltransferase
MQNLPSASTYDDEVKYMPWGKLISEIEELTGEKVPQKGKVLDLLCGTGNLLGRLHSRRPDIFYTGVDLEPEYITFAQSAYPSISFKVGDVLTWISKDSYDLVLVTGGLHHIPYEQQENGTFRTASSEFKISLFVYDNIFI